MGRYEGWLLAVHLSGFILKSACRRGNRIRQQCPNWAKDISISQINAHSETLLEKPAFKENYEHRRCLIAADGFYDWKRSGKSKQPFHFGMKDDSPFAFAGIWDHWRTPQGNVIESCAILTTRPNELLRDVHDRMPVILKSKDYRARGFPLQTAVV